MILVNNMDEGKVHHPADVLLAWEKAKRAAERASGSASSTGK